MQRGATSLCLFSFPGSVVFDAIEEMRLIARGARSGVRLVKTSDELTFFEGNKVGVFFTQEDTLGFFDDEEVRFQWHWRNRDGSACASKISGTKALEFLGSEPI